MWKSNKIWKKKKPPCRPWPCWVGPCWPETLLKPLWPLCCPPPLFDWLAPYFNTFFEEQFVLVPLLKSYLDSPVVSIFSFLSDNCSNTLEGQLTYEDVLNTVKQQENGKSPGTNGFSSKIVKFLIPCNLQRFVETKFYILCYSDLDLLPANTCIKIYHDNFWVTAHQLSVIYIRWKTTGWTSLPPVIVTFDLPPRNVYQSSHCQGLSNSKIRERSDGKWQRNRNKSIFIFI